MVPLHLPGLDLTVLEAIQHNETQNPEYPIFRYDNEDGSTQSITWSEAGKAFTRAGHFIWQSLGNDAARKGDVSSPRIVGMLANLGKHLHPSSLYPLLMSGLIIDYEIDSITFFSTIIGIMRAGFVPFLISTRNSPEAVAHLMAATGSHALLVSEDPVTNELAGAAIRLFEATNDRAEGPKKIQTIVAPSFERLYEHTEETTSANTIPAMTAGTTLDKWDRLCIVAHSSGTTSLPKPISLTHRMIQQQATMNREC